MASTVLSVNGLSWSTTRNSDNLPPLCDPSLSFVEEYNAYYLNRSVTDENKVIYLTFDAGYENGNIERILNTLRDHNAPAAFFILDNLVIRNTDLVKRMIDEGHLVCNHTAKHPDMSTKDSAAFEAELKKMEDIYKQYIGTEISRYYRPPEGKFSRDNLATAQRLGYKTVFWSFAYADWDNSNQPTEEYAIKKIADNTHNGMIILLHPTSSTNASILDRVLTAWESEGYRFGKLDELK